MWRFYLIAALLVAAFGSIVFAHRLAANGWKLRADARGTPPPAQGNTNEGFVTTPPPYFEGEGGWVLSALPDCFEQLSFVQGSPRYVRPHLPAPRDRIAPGATLHAGSCTVLVRPHDLWVFRGRDRLRVPPEARLYRTRSGTALVFSRDGRTELRVYAAVAGEPASR